MNIHSLIDEKSIKTAAGLIKNLRYFSEDTASKKLAGLPALTEIRIPPFEGEGFFQAEGACDGTELNPGFLVYQWVGPQAPLVIYHHGAAEGKFDFGFNRIFKKSLFRKAEVNLIALKGPFCGSNDEFFKNITSLKRYTALIAGSAVTAEEIIKEYRRIGTGPVTVCGTSLGGLVTCLHALAFESADKYLPLYAGPQAGEVFLDSAYSAMADESAKQGHAEEIRNALNFGDEFKKADRANVFPALGRYDRIFKFGLHAPFYREDALTVFNKSHSTGASSAGQLARYIHSRVLD